MSFLRSHLSVRDPAVEEPEREKLTKLFDMLCEACWGSNGLDGADLQEALIEAGVIVETRQTEPCGEVCNCRDFDATFPTTCYRKNYQDTGESNVEPGA